MKILVITGKALGYLGILMTLCFFAFLLHGAQHIYTAMTTGDQLVISYNNIMHRSPTKKWVKVTGCRLALSDMTYRKTFGLISEVYIPVVPSNDDSESNTMVLIASNRKDRINAANAVVKAGGDPAAQLRAMMEQIKSIDPSQPIEGIIRYGLNESESDRKELKQFIPTLDQNYVIIEEGSRPTISKGLKEIGYGLIMLIVGGGLGCLSDKLDPPRKPLDQSKSQPPPLPT